MARRSDHTREEIRQAILDASCHIIESEGLDKLTIRKIAKAINYTSGTLYLVFQDLDEVIVETHIDTLNRLYDHLSERPLDGDPSDALLSLAQGYREFTTANKLRWAALFEHKLPDEKTLPDRYDMAIFKLIGLGVTAIKGLYPEGHEADAIHDARVLWASLYGIMALEAKNKLSRYEDTDAFVTTLVKTYVAGVAAKNMP